MSAVAVTIALSLHLGFRGALSEGAMLSQPQDRGKETTTCRKALGQEGVSAFESLKGQRDWSEVGL